MEDERLTIMLPMTVVVLIEGTAVGRLRLKVKPRSVHEQSSSSFSSSILSPSRHYSFATSITVFTVRSHGERDASSHASFLETAITAPHANGALESDPIRLWCLDGGISPSSLTVLCRQPMASVQTGRHVVRPRAGPALALRSGRDVPHTGR